MSEWMPIETAPKDGTEFLAWWPHLERQAVTYWAKSTRWGANWFAYVCKSSAPRNMSAKPSHWMPLPPAPQGVE